MYTLTYGFSMRLFVCFAVFFLNNLNAVPVFVLGPQHSGTRWMGSLLAIHSEIEEVMHMSYPGAYKWNSIADTLVTLKNECPDLKIVICEREKNCNNLANCRSKKYTRKTVHYRRNYDNLVDDAIALIYEDIQGFDRKDIVVLSYESLVLHRELTLRQTFRLLGISEENYNYNAKGRHNFNGWCLMELRTKDGNAKYVKDFMPRR